MKIFLILMLFFSGCATRSKPVFVKPKKVLDTWASKKRECHAFYLNTFGLSSESSISICKEELERNHK